MSKVQGKESEILNNLSGTGIVTELDSHLRDLEKNIAVAREFIKLADESYTELRHKWNLIQEEARNKTETGTAEKASSSARKKESRITHTSEPEENTESKIRESIGTATDNAPGLGKSKNRNKHESSRRQKDSGAASQSPTRSENANRSEHQAPKNRKNKAHSERSSLADSQ